MANTNNKNIKAVDNQVVVNNRYYFLIHCTTHDLCTINRMWLRHLDRSIGRDAPLDTKTLEYDRWLDMDFDPTEWDRCQIKIVTKPAGYLLSKAQKAVLF